MSDLQTLPELDQQLDPVFGAHTDPMPLLEERARERFAGEPHIVWECDASTFIFSFVSASAEEALGYPRRRWTDEPTFWADVVLHPEDRDESVSFCAAETGQCRDHAFEYRAKTADGRVVRLRDFVRVVAEDGRPRRLRGIMIAVPE
jgi:PAS domain-containing protein